MKTYSLLPTLLLCGIVVLGACTDEKSSQKEDKGVAFRMEELQACKADSDCVRVAAACCGCTSGGADISINKQSSEAWQKHLTANCKNMACSTVMSEHASCKARPTCEKGQCTLKP